VSPGDNVLPVANGCLFSLTKPTDLVASDRANYSVTEVVATATLGVNGPPDASVMVVCRLSPRAEFWFWFSADGHWNVDLVDGINQPKDLVDGQRVEQLRQYVSRTGGPRNEVQFKCAGSKTSQTISLALNVNNRQFAALNVPMPAPDRPLDRPSNPWFVDVGARLITAGTLDGVVAKVTLYDSE
jgi:hypothetical protein